MIEKVVYSFYVLCLSILLVGIYMWAARYEEAHAKSEKTWDTIQIEKVGPSEHQRTQVTGK